MSKLTRLVTTKPAMSNSAAALRIPTVTPLKVITYTPSRPAPQDTPLPTMEKTCGLFDFVDPTVTTESRSPSDHLFHCDPLLSSTYLADKSDLDMDNNLIDSFFTIDLQSASQTTKSMDLSSTKKSFVQKLNEANLNIKIVKPDSDQDALGTPMNLDLDDADLAKLLTPNTERMCLQYLHSIPADNQLESAGIVTEEQLLLSLGLETAPIVQQPPPPVPQNPVLSESSDHLYSAAPLKRRRLSSSFDDEASSVFSADADSVSTPTGKKQRAKGIYRAEDVTNQVELVNYLERRKKNNISSKISRANKKNYYAEMEAKCESIEVNNRSLEIKIKKLEKLNQVMKDYLKEAFVGNLK